MDSIRVIVADDHPGMRAGIRKLLETASDVVVVDEAGDGEETLRLVEEQQADVLLLDFELPRLTGVEVAERLKAINSPIRILALTAYTSPHIARELHASGVAGYLSKAEAPKYLIEAVRGVAHDETGWFRLEDDDRDGDDGDENEIGQEETSSAV